MSVAKVTEITSSSTKSFDDAVAEGILSLICPISIVL